MFALEIAFADDPQNVEHLVVRRPRFVLGSSRGAHIAIEDMKQLGFDLEFSRGLGSSFRCQPTNVEGKSHDQLPSFLTNTYSDDASLNLGPLTLKVIALESDMLIRESDPPDKSAVRVLRQAAAFESPQFPAWVILGASPTVISFSPDQTITVGRSNKCAVRVDAPDVSAEHARVGYESGSFWIEDLGSTNGTFIDNQQLSGRQLVSPETKITLGGQVTIVGIVSNDQLQHVASGAPKSHAKEDGLATTRALFPAIMSQSDLVRPGKFILQPGSTIIVGRDPESDIWIGAPHISRKHCSFTVSKTGKVTISDISRNGIAWENGILPRQEPFDVEAGSQMFDLGGGVTLIVCFNEEDEAIFKSTHGLFSSAATLKTEEGEVPSIASVMGFHSETKLPLPEKLAKQSEVNSKQNLTFGEIAQNYRKLDLRSRIGLTFFIISLAVIGFVVITLIVHGFR